MSVTSVGNLLAELNLTAQKPLQRAYQRDPEAIERWQRNIFPTLVKQSKMEGAEINFWDESGFRADAVHGKTWAVRGKTPVVNRPGQRQSISAASAVNAKDAFWFATYQGGLSDESFVELLKQLMYRRKKPLHINKPDKRKQLCVTIMAFSKGVSNVQKLQHCCHRWQPTQGTRQS